MNLSHLKKEDLLFDEVLNPAVLWCKSGHPIPEGMRVYSVRGPVLPRHLWGQYCNTCVSAAHTLARRKKAVETPKEAPVPPSCFSLRPKAVKMALLRAGFTGGINETAAQSEKEPWERFLEELG